MIKKERKRNQENKKQTKTNKKKHKYRSLYNIKQLSDLTMR